MRKINTDNINVQPDSLRFQEDKYDTLEVIQIDDHLVLIQVDADGVSETLVIGPQQAAKLAQLVQSMQKGA